MKDQARPQRCVRPCVNCVLRTLGTPRACSRARTFFRVSFLPTMVVNHATLSCWHTELCLNLWKHLLHQLHIAQTQDRGVPAAW